MRVFFVLFLVIPAIALALSDEESTFLFKLWAKQHGRTYPNSKEAMKRRDIFRNNLEFIQKHNSMGKSYTMEMNHFGDFTAEEFKEFHTFHYKGYNKAQTHRMLGDAPASIDWREKGAVTPIKDQGQCGSCWAFSAVGSMEGAHFVASGKLVSLSEQQLVDCSGKYGNEGCNGGLMDQAFQYVIDNGGIDTESCYPYKAEDQNCKYDSSCIGAKITSYVNVTSNDDSALIDAVGNKGPVSVAIYANGLQFYSSGIYDDANCPTDVSQLDHGVVVVGYGHDDSSNKDFYIVKNSWGSGWGENGYVRMKRGSSVNMCGILDLPSYPIAASSP